MKNLFYKPINISDKENNIWWWSDTHWGHKCEKWSEPLWMKRGFSSVEEHDKILIDRWNSKIKVNDTIFHLGDIVFSVGAYERLIILLNELNFGTMYLLFGNHHAGTKQLFENLNGNCYVINKDKKVIFCPNYIEAIVNGQPIVLSHYAIASWNGQGRGSWMTHGHSHSSLVNSELGRILYKSKIIDVGVECCPSPISFKELKENFRYNENISFDHHDKNTRNPF